jgi:8-oxo-dGTP pyrophosphatase MutT (NUDIX family)
MASPAGGVNEMDRPGKCSGARLSSRAVSLAVRYIEAYVFCLRPGGARVLAMRRSAGRRLAGVWQPVTGKRESGETPFAAAAREVLEETGLRPARWWRLESPVILYDESRGGASVLPRFVAEVPCDARVVRSKEHDAHAFLTLAAAGRRFLWDSQREALAEIRRQVLRGGALAKALELPVAAPRRRPRT